MNAKRRLATRLIQIVLSVSIVLCCLSACPPAWADSFDSNGVRIHYVVEGHGSPVILIHGLYSSALMNWQMPGTMKQLARHFQVIAFDNRGHGQSGKPLQEGVYGIQMVEDVVRLMDHLRIAKAQIVGYSMGGMIAMKMVVMHPDRVNDAVIGGFGWLRKGSLLSSFWQEIPNNERSQASLVPLACLHGLSQMGLTKQEVKSIRVPITIIVGEDDPCGPLYAVPLSLARPDFRQIIVPGANHISCIAMPQFKNDLEEVLEQNIRRASHLKAQTR